MTNDEFVTELGVLLDQYKSVVKPLLAEVEAKYEKFPIPLYNEVRSFVDHIARCYDLQTLSKSQDLLDDQLYKASHHIKRMILDCYKLLNADSRSELEKFDANTRYIDLRKVDSAGTFSSRLDELRRRSSNLVAQAKKLETSGETLRAYEAYQDAHNCHAINKVKAKFWGGKVGWIVWSLITFIIGCILTNNNQAVTNVIKHLFSNS